MADCNPDVMFADPGTPAGLRIILQARYGHLVLKFLAPPVTESGLYEASWIGGQAKSDTEEEMLRAVCEELTKSEIREPNVPLRVSRTC